MTAQAGAASAPPPPPSQPYNAAPVAPQPAASAGMADNVASLLCYVLGLITGILFLVIEPYNKNKAIRFHAFQSIFFNVAMIALFIVLGIIGAVFAYIAPFLTFALMGILHLLLWVACLVVWILLMVKAYQGQRWKLPFIGDLAEKQA